MMSALPSATTCIMCHQPNSLSEQNFGIFSTFATEIMLENNQSPQGISSRAGMMLLIYPTIVAALHKAHQRLLQIPKDGEGSITDGNIECTQRFVGD